MKIEFIQYPYLFTDNGKRLHSSQVVGNIRVGVDLEEIDENTFRVTGNLVDDGCVNGVCPIK